MAPLDMSDTYGAGGTHIADLAPREPVEPPELAGRGESKCSENGEKAEMRAFEDGLSPNGPLTAIIL